MTETVPKITIIPANPEVKGRAVKRQLRVAAYCRVSTDDKEQLTSYEAQKTFYTDKIMQNPDWTMAGIFADEGITGTSAAKRPEFLRMIRLCRQRKIDLILVKSISRFARNTVDCLNYIRALKDLGIAVIFEKENINTMDSESEMLITMMGAFAQAESESISTMCAGVSARPCGKAGRRFSTKTSTAMGRTKTGIHTSSPKKRKWSDGSTKASCRDRASDKSRAGWTRRESPQERARSGPSPPLRIS